MRGYRILYLNEKGEREVTFFGEPHTSFSLSPEDLYTYIDLIFTVSHPNCRIIEITKHIFDDD